MYAFRLVIFGNPTFYYIIGASLFCYLIYSVDGTFDSTFPTNMVVYNTGDVSWIPPGIFKISCKIDIKW